MTLVPLLLLLGSTAFALQDPVERSDNWHQFRGRTGKGAIWKRGLPQRVENSAGRQVWLWMDGGEEGIPWSRLAYTASKQPKGAF